MKLAATVTGKVSRADKELSSAVTLMDENPESSPNPAEWSALPSALDSVSAHSKTLELMTLRRIALGMRDQILAEPNPRTINWYESPLPPLTLNGVPVKNGYYVRVLARFNDADFARLLRTYKQKKMKDLSRLFDWAASDAMQPMDQDGELFLKSKSENHEDWRASESGKAHKAIMDRKFARQEFTPREITSELVAAAVGHEDDTPPESETHEIVRSVIRGYRDANPECPPFITVNRGGYFAQVFIEQATPDDLSSFVSYRRQQALDMAASADAAQKLLDFLNNSIDAPRPLNAAA